MGVSCGFSLLHERVQRWIWAQKWSELRDIQERAIAPVLAADRDIVISAATAAGKTEAAFLPACSNLAREPAESIGILYVSPLKALINDQYRRLQGLCETLEIPVTPWHGDVLQSAKNRQFRAPRGIVLITPESLESLLLNRGAWCHSGFADLRYVIIDEFHAFLGSERGRQLQSLLHRLEFLLGKTIPRIALSATLGDMEQVAESLRPRKTFPYEIISSTASQSDVKIQIRGYREPVSENCDQPRAFEYVTEDLFRLLRGKSHLIFANSRRQTEEVSVALADKCEQHHVPNEFFPHHGSLSKELREGLEKRLQEDKLPTSAACTMTLELGIDIGHVDSIAQVTAPYSVSSLRQRLGRSGRRGEASILRMFITENELTEKSHITDRLRMETFQCVAMINLLLKKWYEPANDGQYHFSTLVQQVLSVVGHYGGVRADQLWNLLCGSGPFGNVEQKMFATLLRALGAQELLTQTHDGLLALGVRGERMVEHFTFYTAFNTPEEYRLEYEGRVLGSIPVSMPLAVGQLILFAGKRWEVLHVAEEEKRISLRPAKGGRPPRFNGQGQVLHAMVRQEMRDLYTSESLPAFCNKDALSLFEEGRRCFVELKINASPMLQMGNSVHIFPWLGDKTINTMTMLLRNAGLKADSCGGVIDVRDTDVDMCKSAILTVLASPRPSARQLAESIPNTFSEKHDTLIPKELRDLNYGAKFFDVDGAWHWFCGIVAVR
ncbi:DEAD/DEAH box helicase [Desulfovibrio sp. OttesenSCG-928-G15]|nr:DEAD/DEAH box helicase [Desulfovibrio sp. OttesenSCG-928-G15]